MKKGCLIVSAIVGLVFGFYSQNSFASQTSLEFNNQLIFVYSDLDGTLTQIINACQPQTIDEILKCY